MIKPIMEEALDEIRRSGRLDIQERVFAKMKPHDPLADLVARFSKALLEKLRAAEAKYCYKNDWLRSDWEAECQRHLAEHLAKGDPRDVAAYAAFCWHHGWPTAVREPRTAAGSLD
jgi:light-regulated signal transduction histidine kinase (bacteriophytochrome)